MREVLIGGELVQVHPIIEGLANASHDISEMLADMKAGLMGVEEFTIGNVEVMIEATANEIEFCISFREDYEINIEMVAGEETLVSLIYNGESAAKALELQKIDLGTPLGSIFKLPMCLAAAAEMQVIFEAGDTNEYWDDCGVHYSSATLVSDYHSNAQIAA